MIPVAVAIPVALAIPAIPSIPAIHSVIPVAVAQVQSRTEGSGEGCSESCVESDRERGAVATRSPHVADEAPAALAGASAAADTATPTVAAGNTSPYTTIEHGVEVINIPTTARMV